MALNSNVLQAKDPDKNTWYAIDWTNEIVELREPNTVYAASDIVAVPDQGFYFQAENAGKTAGNNPIWPLLEGGTVRDGSIVWKAINPVGASIPTITLSTWVVETR